MEREKDLIKGQEVSAVTDRAEENFIIKFKKPYKFEGKEYTEIDLSGMEDITGADMISVNRIMSRSSGSMGSMPEMSLEYACHLAARAAKQPVEFFLGMPPYPLMKVKDCVLGFLFGMG